MSGDLAGNVVVVTGASSGLGLAATVQLTSRGAQVVMAVRDLDKGERARLRLSDPERAVVMALDVSSLASVEAFSQSLTERVDRLDVLLNNAGVMATPPSLTADGVEHQWATNHLGHFALTGHLLELLVATAASRVVAVSSLAATSGRLDRHDPTSLDGYRRFQAYANSKLANLVFAGELHQRLARAGATTMALAAHPGVTHTNLISSTRLPGLHHALKLASRFTTQPVTAGVEPLLRAATDPAAVGGQYWGPSGRGQSRGPAGVVPIPEPATAPGLGARLWTQSIELSGVAYLTDHPT